MMNTERENDASQDLLGIEKRAKNHVEHKIEGFCDQSIINNVLYHILILLQKTTTKVPLDTWLTTTFLTFEWTEMVNSTCLGLKMSQNIFSA